MQKLWRYTGASARRLHEGSIVDASKSLVRPTRHSYSWHDDLHYAPSQVGHFWVLLQTILSLKSHVGCRASFLYSQSSLGRGQDTREAHLNALFRYDLNHIRPDKGRVLALISFQGKTNQVCKCCKYNVHILNLSLTLTSHSFTCRTEIWNSQVQWGQNRWCFARWAPSQCSSLHGGTWRRKKSPIFKVGKNGTALPFPHNSLCDDQIQTSSNMFLQWIQVRLDAFRRATSHSLLIV